MYDIASQASFRSYGTKLVYALAIAALLTGMALAVRPALAAAYYVNVATGNDANDCLSAGTACATIQHAVDLAAPGDTINVAAGTYAEMVSVNKVVTVIGAGSGSNPLVDTIISGSSSGNGLTLSAGADASNRVVIEDLRVTGFAAGIVANSFTTLDNVASVSNTTYGITMSPLQDLVITGSKFNSNAVGVKIASTASVDDVTISNSEFNDNSEHGWYSDNGNGSGSNITDLSISNSTFNNNVNKGFYTEKLHNAVFDNITVDNSGTGGPQNHRAGFDLNLKYGNYSNIQFLNSTFSGNGTGDPNGGGLLIKARSTGSYAGNPATLTGVTLSNLVVTNNGDGTYGAGIRIGESNNSFTGIDAGPTGVTVSGSFFSGNGPHALRNATAATVVTAENNYWDSAAGPAAGDAVSAGVDYSPWLTSGTDTDLGTAGFQGSLASLGVDDDSPQTDVIGAIQEGINSATTGGSVHVAAGSYPEHPNVNKTLTLAGAQAGVDARTRAAVPESILANAVSINANDVAIDGFTIEGGNGAGGDFGTGLDVPGTRSGHQIVNNIFQNNTFGLYLNSSGATQSVVQHNLFQNNNLAGAASGNAIYADQGSHNVLVDSNKFAGGHTSAAMVFAGTQSNLTISNNTLVNDSSIVLFSTTTAAITGNTSTGFSGSGIFLGGSNSGITVSGNAFMGGLSSALRVSNFSSANSNITVQNNSLTNNGYGIRIDATALTGVMTVSQNVISGNTTSGLSNLSPVNVDAEENFWGVASGPGGQGAGTGNSVTTNVDFSPWCVNAACTATAAENGDGDLAIAPGTTGADIQAVIDSAPAGSTIILPTGVVNTPLGGFVITTPGLIIELSPGTVIVPSSPCFTVAANDTTITAAFLGSALCTPTSGSHGIDVTVPVNNLTILGLEFHGLSTVTGDAIHVGANVNGLKIVDNYIHDMDGDGIEYAAGVVVSGPHTVQGNLFAANTGFGINNVDGPLYTVDYNAWNSLAGPGGEVNGNLDATPFTHASLSLASSGSPVADKVAVGQQITYTVNVAAAELRGADFDLNFDEDRLTVLSLTNSGSFPTSGLCALNSVGDANSTGVIRFCGNSGLTSVNGAAVAVFTVVFEGESAGVVTLDLDTSDDTFSMAPPSGDSNNVYASALTDQSMEVFGIFSVTGTIDLQGRANESGAVLTFAAGSFQGYGPFVFATSGSFGAISASGVVADTYNITVAMARYLDVTPASLKSKAISTGNASLTTLTLFGGDVDDDHLIDIGDLAAIGGEYGNSGGGIGDVNTDINNDGTISIFDLVLAGGNYLKSSATAYTTGWIP